MDDSAERHISIGSIERHAFYERTKTAYAVVATSERRGYGCFVLTKGVLDPEGKVIW